MKTLKPIPGTGNYYAQFGLLQADYTRLQATVQVGIFKAITAVHVKSQESKESDQIMYSANGSEFTDSVVQFMCDHIDADNAGLMLMAGMVLKKEMDGLHELGLTYQFILSFSLKAAGIEILPEKQPTPEEMIDKLSALIEKALIDGEEIDRIAKEKREEEIRKNTNIN